MRTAGTGLTFGVPFTEYDTVFFGARYEHNSIETNASSPQAYINYVTQYGNGTDASTNAYLTTIGWQRDSRDSGITPTRGRYQRANLETAVPIGQLRYYRASYQQTYYYPIATNYTLSLNGEFDYARGYDGTPLPVFKNFYAGGIGSVRGYDTSTLGPRDVNGDPIGGAKRFNANLELLFPLPGTGKDRAFRGFVFADTGGVFAERQKITADGYVPTDGIRYSVGFGVNWLSPLGALRVSYGVPLHSKPGDNLQRLQFNIGNGF